LDKVKYKRTKKESYQKGNSLIGKPVHHTEQGNYEQCHNKHKKISEELLA
jgi:hypothetical protein